MSEIEVQLKKGVLGLCVLALLSRGDSYAYEIASRMAAAVDMGEGTIYPLMRRMQSDGLVVTYLEESPSGPPRKYYRITDTGRSRLAEQVEEWRGFTAAVEELLDGAAVAPVQEEPSHDA
ncbi:MAG: PadR family transcriptional regulator [Novosphingobium lindaniclasticum]|jgi:PadR family transcriptional regulator PadR|uniref:PadR family transcriptional regulator n=1 Tax=Novosphingobium lindaniclasticum LE124 TaxID=1096930 RepID=T0H8G3_9SPHN|nr:helix-turn-helix transcriptional regulator [Novosphingobium lindaniclasticum]EQB12646.1 PadR family transcriptional regulator [Novosphingobium lindaniclasticum LE124]MDF2637804.1 PadR family transcriptional regulator [Novosphingobium lindaniclasticum]